MKLGYVLAIVGIIFVGIIALLGASYVTNFNYGNRAEKTIVAVYTNNQNVLSSYTITVMEMAQIAEMQKDDVLAVVTAAMSSRYGADGSKAMMQFITEQNPNLDPAVYRNLQNVIAAGRVKFENNQTKLIDTKRVYETKLGTFWTGMWLRIAGYPSIDLDEYKIVVAASTKETFETGIDAPLKIR